MSYMCDWGCFDFHRKKLLFSWWCNLDQLEAVLSPQWLMIGWWDGHHSICKAWISQKWCLLAFKGWHWKVARLCNLEWFLEPLEMISSHWLNSSFSPSILNIESYNMKLPPFDPPTFDCTGYILFVLKMVILKDFGETSKSQIAPSWDDHIIYLGIEWNSRITEET